MFDLVVEGGPPNDGVAPQHHGAQQGDRRQAAAAANLHLYPLQRRGPLERREFGRHGPPGARGKDTTRVKTELDERRKQVRQRVHTFV